MTLKTNYLIATLFFLTGSLMLFLHKLASTVVHFLGNFVNEKTIKLSSTFDYVSILFILFGIVIAIYNFIKNRKPENAHTV